MKLPIIRHPYPGKVLLLEYFIQYILYSTLIIISIPLDVFHDYESYQRFGQINYWNNLIEHKFYNVFVGAPVVWMYGLFTFFPTIFFLRSATFYKSKIVNEMWLRILLTGLIWIICFITFFILPIGLGAYALAYGLMLIGGPRFYLLATLAYLFGAALLAPILTYRLTGYCFDSDFSLPPWSHGRWGFSKLAPVAKPAATPAPIDRPDPDVSPPNSGGKA